MRVFSRRQIVAGLAAAAAISPRGAAVAAPDLRSSMFRRSLLCELPFLPGVVQDRLAAKVYPQGLAYDAVDGEIFIFYAFLKRDSNFGTLCCVYDAPSRRLKTWFLTPESCRESFVFRRLGSKRLIYTLGLENPLAYDVTNDAKPGARVEAAKVFDPEERSYTQLTWTGREFVYMSGERDARRHKGKQRFIRADAEFNKLGAVTFPLKVVGSYDNIQVLRYPKAQGVAYSNGLFVFSCGKNYAPNGGSKGDNPDIASTQQGLIACDANGRLIADALVSPDFAIDQFGKLAGHTIQMIENESITSADGGTLVALWQASHPRQWASEGRNSGLLITVEMSILPAALDFSAGAVRLDDVLRRDINRDPLH